MNFPTMLQLESSTACSARCIFCPHSELKRPQGSMSDELYIKILNDAARCGIKQVLLFLNGEPFIFSRIFQWLDELRSRGMTTIFYTNASHLDSEKAARLVRYSDTVTNMIFSVSGIDQLTHHDIMGLDHERVKNNITNFMSVNQGKIPCVAQMPLFSKTESWVDQWQKLWEPIVGTAHTTCMYNYAGRIHDRLETRLPRKYCGRLDHLYVLWDGRVCLCCMDSEGEVILGNLNNQSVSEVFNSVMMNSFRDSHRRECWDNLSLCNVCNMNV